MSHILKKALGVHEGTKKNMYAKGFARWFSNGVSNSK
jgi:hypothetical protein